MNSKNFSISPDKLLKSGIRSITRLNRKLYSGIKSASKRNADITFIGEKKQEQVKAQLFEYDQHALLEIRDLPDFEKLKAPEENKVYWVNFHGIHEVRIFEGLAKVLRLDRITIRHVVDTTQRPKVEEHENYLFFTIKSILERIEDEIEIEQLSFVLGKSYLVSFQEKKGDHFEHIRHRIRDNLGLVRKKSSDFLLYLLLDAILDNYFETIDALNEDLEALEKETLKDPTQNTLIKLEDKKKTGSVIKKSLVPLRDAIVNILNDKTRFIDKNNMKYFRDLKNNCMRAIEEIESFNQSLDSLTNIYFSSLSQKMNEIMKVLTLVATVFIPLTFIAGIYGMNFDYMPELHYRYGYFVVWGVMVVLFIAMLIYFKRKKWL